VCSFPPLLRSFLSAPSFYSYLSPGLKGLGWGALKLPGQVRVEPDRQMTFDAFWVEKVFLLTTALVHVHEIIITK